MVFLAKKRQGWGARFYFVLDEVLVQWTSRDYRAHLIE